MGPPRDYLSPLRFNVRFQPTFRTRLGRHQIVRCPRHASNQVEVVNVANPTSQTPRQPAQVSSLTISQHVLEKNRLQVTGDVDSSRPRETDIHRLHHARKRGLLVGLFCQNDPN